MTDKNVAEFFNRKAANRGK